MHDTKQRLSLLWIFALLNYLYADVVDLRVTQLPLCGRCSSVRNCRYEKFIRASPTMGSDGFSGLDGNTHRHDCGVSTTSV